MVSGIFYFNQFEQKTGLTSKMNSQLAFENPNIKHPVHSYLVVRFLALVTTMVTTVDHGNHRSNDRGNHRSNHHGYYDHY